MLSIARSRALCCLEPVRVSSWLDPCALASLHQDGSHKPILSVESKYKQQYRGMARGRNYYLKGASNKQDISEEAKHLLKHARNPEDKSWKLGQGIEEPMVMDNTTVERKRATQYIVKHMGENINDGEDTVKYYPHAGEEIPAIQPSPVLMVKRVKKLNGETWFNKDYCGQIGLGKNDRTTTVVFLPNIPSVSSILFKIKHIVEITPVTFPNGIPDDFDPDKHGYKLKPNGEFVVHSSLRVDMDALVKDAHWMKLNKFHVAKEGMRHWKSPYTSVLGDSHYHQDTRWRDNSKADSQYIKNQRLKWSSNKK
jgi:hypothetical protein